MAHWSDTYGASEISSSQRASNAQSIATDAMLKAIQACKDGTGTKSQCDMVKALAREMVASTGKNLEELKGMGNITIPANPIVPWPIEVPAGDLAEAAVGVGKVAEAATTMPGAQLGRVAKVLAWAGEHPYLALAIGGGAVAAVTIGPALLQVLPLLLVKRK